MRRALTYTVREVVPYINWLYFFHAWGMEPRFATVADVHDCPACREAWIASFSTAEQPKAREACRLYREATELLGQWADKPICHALILLAEAYSDGDDIVVAGERIPLLRQQHVGRSGYTLCLSDFIAPRGDLPAAADPVAHRMGVFAATVKVCASKQESSLLGRSQRAQPILDNEVADPQPSTLIHQPSTLIPQPSTIIHQPNTLLHSTLADRLAEATAERMHEEVRKRYWGYAKEEQLTMQELHAEKFQGIRPAVGYPSLPDQSIIFLIDELLHLEDIGIGLSEHGSMIPHCSVSGFMFGHPKAHYFSVGSVGEDQLRDYACRRGIAMEELKRYITPQ